MIIYTDIKIFLSNDEGGRADGSGDDDGAAYGGGSGDGGAYVNANGGWLW